MAEPKLHILQISMTCLDKQTISSHYDPNWYKKNALACKKLVGK